MHYHAMDKIFPVQAALATLATLASGAAGTMAWAEKLTSAIGALTALVALPTAILCLIYWSIKVRREYKQSNKK